MNKNIDKPVLKVLQIASYQSNLGDNANLSGSRKLLRKGFSEFNLQFSDLDINDFSWGMND